MTTYDEDLRKFLFEAHWRRRRFGKENDSHSSTSWKYGYCCERAIKAIEMRRQWEESLSLWRMALLRVQK